MEKRSNVLPMKSVPSTVSAASTSKAIVAAVVQEGGATVLMIGPGDHTCQRWELSESLAKKLLIELFKVQVG